MKALLGTSAYVIQAPAALEPRRKSPKVVTEEQPQVEEVLAVKADKWEDSPKTEEVPALPAVCLAGATPIDVTAA